MTGPTVTGSGPLSASGPTGSIYDLGYRSYDGPRLGRGHAIRSLFAHSLRSAYGIGRGGRAKIAPLVFGGMAVMPAVAVVGIVMIAARMGVGDQIRDQAPIRYGSYYQTISTIVMLFCAAQAPELFGRDQRHGVLSLYFTRPLRRIDYALARVGGFVAALLVLVLFPQIVLFLGRVLLSEDVAGAIADDLQFVPGILGQGLLMSGLLGSLAMVISAHTPRRAYATAAIIAAFSLPGIAAGIVAELGSGPIADALTLLSPNLVLDGTNAVLFAQEPGTEFFFVDLPGWAYFAAAFVAIAGSIALTVRHLRRIDA